jgi:hypothetical protein
MREYRAVYNAPCRSEKSGKPGYVPACAAVCQVPTCPGKARLRPFFQADIDWPTLPQLSVSPEGIRETKRQLFAEVGLAPQFWRQATVGLETAAFHHEFFHLTQLSVKHQFLPAPKRGVSWTIR